MSKWYESPLWTQITSLFICWTCELWMKQIFLCFSVLLKFVDCIAAPVENICQRWGKLLLCARTQISSRHSNFTVAFSLGARGVITKVIAEMSGSVTRRPLRKPTFMVRCLRDHGQLSKQGYKGSQSGKIKLSIRALKSSISSFSCCLCSEWVNFFMIRLGANH